MQNGKTISATLSVLLSDYGVRYAFVSSGSRSMPVVTALAVNKAIDLRLVIDERVAAFMALGLAETASEPVAIICTSGTAVLNYSPAVAEAYHKSVPLIVISCDRPACRIGQNDGQTLQQPGALAGFVKTTVDIGDNENDNFRMSVRELNRALALACSGRPGPVHINIRLAEPLSQTEAVTTESYKIDIIASTPKLSDVDANSILSELTGKKIMVFAGVSKPDTDLDKQLSILSSNNNVIIVSDVTSNLRCNHIVSDIDTAVVSFAGLSEEYLPDILITFGGTPLSRRFKEWIRNSPHVQHWQLDDELAVKDTYLHATKVIVTDKVDFFSTLCRLPQHPNTGFATRWHDAYTKVTDCKKELIYRLQWCDLKAVSMIMHSLPDHIILHLSNGMTIRYANLFDYSRFDAVFSNRGVNGIDGSTSTALGSSLFTSRPNVLLSGDMSALYDIASLYSGYAGSNFRMILFDNSGGEIFRSIDATRGVTDRERLLCAIPEISWEKVAQSCHMDFYHASCENSLMSVMPQFMTGNRPALLVIKTAPGNSLAYPTLMSEIGKQYKQQT